MQQLKGMAEPSHLMYWNWNIFRIIIISLKLNRHIWCIEMRASSLIVVSRGRWTVTFDVLKYIQKAYRPIDFMGWTVTFDVLKFSERNYYTRYWWLNRHIWCIEIRWWRRKHRLHQAEPSHLMYWNTRADVHQKAIRGAEPSHLMYWNILALPQDAIHEPLNRHIWCIEIAYAYEVDKDGTAEPSHLMYWNSARWGTMGRKKKLNRHIWCIEMFYRIYRSVVQAGLNRHIWCIEITNITLKNNPDSMLNRHIWCIEILECGQEENCESAEPSHLMYWNGQAA